MANFKNNEEGVSAVIGVILMVAITVILAAVIAAFVFQLGNQLPGSSHTVNAQITRVGSTDVIQVKTMSGDVNLLVTGDIAKDIATYTVTIATGTGNGHALTDSTGSADATTSAQLTANEIGKVMFFSVGKNADITVVAHYTDGTTSNVFSGPLA